MTHTNPKIINAIQNAVNLILNTEQDACNAIDSGGKCTYCYDASDIENEATDITVTLTIEANPPADYFENEDGEIFKRAVDDAELEEEAQRIIYELNAHKTHRGGGCGKCRK